MNAEGSVVDKAEQVKWWDAMDALYSVPGRKVNDVERGLQMARECRHPDAEWLAALFPAGIAVTREQMERVMRSKSDDPRAMFLAWSLDVHGDAEALLQRAAHMGYAPAQAQMTSRAVGKAAFEWARKAGAQGDRDGIYQLGYSLLRGQGCTEDREAGLDFLRQSAELGCPNAQEEYGWEAFGERHWQRLYWWGCAGSRGFDSPFVGTVLTLVPTFETGELGRVLHTVAPFIRKNLDCSLRTMFRSVLGRTEMESFQLVVKLHDAMLERAARAIACWSVVGMRCGVVKDVRVLISKMLWKEPWHWSANRT
jgi:hypothetical protein